MAHLLFFLCNSKQRGKRTVVRRHKTDTLTQVQPLLNCFAYECSNYGEFKELQERVGQKDGWFAGVLVKEDNGTLRFPEPNDLVSQLPSPAAPPKGDVVVTSSQPDEGSLSAPPVTAPPIEVNFDVDDEPVVADTQQGPSAEDIALLEKLREHITNHGPKRVNGMAVTFNTTQEHIKGVIFMDHSGLRLKQAGWIDLA